MQKLNAITIAMAIAFSLPAAAQNAAAATDTTAAKAEDNDIAIEVISVTATKRKTKLMETPVAISALSEAQLRQSGVNNVKDIADLVPGLDISTATDQAAPE